MGPGLEGGRWFDGDRARLGRARGCGRGSVDPPGSLCSHLEYIVKMGDIHLNHTSSAAVVVPVRDIVIHKHYSAVGIIENDIALALLEFPVNFSLHVQPVCLPEKAFMVPAGMECWVTGWGKLKEKGETEARVEAQARQEAPWCPVLGLQAKGGGREAISSKWVRGEGRECW